MGWPYDSILPGRRLATRLCTYLLHTYTPVYTRKRPNRTITQANFSTTITPTMMNTARNTMAPTMPHNSTLYWCCSGVLKLLKIVLERVGSCWLFGFTPPRITVSLRHDSNVPNQTKPNFDERDWPSYAAKLVCVHVLQRHLISLCPPPCFGM